MADTYTRVNELLKGNPLAAQYGFPRGAPDPGPEPDISHLLVPLTPRAPQPDELDAKIAAEEAAAKAEGDPDAPDISHLLTPLAAPVADAATASPAIRAKPGQPIAANTAAEGGLGPGINTAANAFIRNPIANMGQAAKQMARDPLGTMLEADRYSPSNLVQMGLQKLGLIDKTTADVMDENDHWSPEKPIGLLQQAGEAMTEYSQRPGLQPAPGWENGLTDKVAGALGTTSLFLATSVLGRGSIPAGSLLGSYMSAGEAFDEAVRQGATPEQIKQAVRIAGLGGTTEPFPIEVILNRIPMPLVGKAVGIFGRILAKVAAEGGQEVVQQGIQNFSERYVYNPDQDMTEGMLESFALGELVGGTFAAPVELAGLAAPAAATPPGTPPATPGGTPPPPGAPAAPGTVPPAPGAAPPAPPTTGPTSGMDYDPLPPLPDEEGDVAAPPPEPPVPGAAAPGVPPTPTTVPAAAAGAAPGAPPADAARASY